MNYSQSMRKYVDVDIQAKVAVDNPHKIIQEVLIELIKNMKRKVEIKDPTVKGFNIGTNLGKIAGQSIMHCHIHLIARRVGDVENPQGGVRSVIPQKQHYKRKL